MTLNALSPPKFSTTTAIVISSPPSTPVASLSTSVSSKLSSDGAPGRMPGSVGFNAPLLSPLTLTYPVASRSSGLRTVKLSMSAWATWPARFSADNPTMFAKDNPSAIAASWIVTSKLKSIFCAALGVTTTSPKTTVKAFAVVSTLLETGAPSVWPGLKVRSVGMLNVEDRSNGRGK